MGAPKNLGHSASELNVPVNLILVILWHLSYRMGVNSSLTESLDFPIGQKRQLELYLGYFTHTILIRETQVDARSVDIPVTQLFLQGIDSSSTV